MASAPARARLARRPALRLVVTTVPPARATAIARTLVAAGVAACGNVVPRVRSVYRWEGRVRADPEALLVIKTTAAALPGCLEALAAAHPYQVPEVVVVRPEAVGRAYDAWASEATRRPPRTRGPGR